MSENAKELVKFGKLWVLEMVEELRRNEQTSAMKEREGEITKWRKFANGK